MYMGTVNGIPSKLTMLAPVAKNLSSLILAAHNLSSLWPGIKTLIFPCNFYVLQPLRPLNDKKLKQKKLIKTSVLKYDGVCMMTMTYRKHRTKVKKRYKMVHMDFRNVLS